MQDVILPRSGDTPLRFRGELLAASVPPLLRPGKRSRRFTVEVYSSEGGVFVTSIRYRSDYDEPERDYAAGGLFAWQASAYLRGFDPAQCVRGFPPGERWAIRQTRLLEDVRRRFAQQVLEVLTCEVFA